MKTKNILISPLLSTITYINDSIYPTFITNTSEKKLKEKNIVNINKGIILSFPKKLKHISFDGSNLHGVFNIYENIDINNKNRKTLMFNIWDLHIPLGIKNKIFDNNEKIFYENKNQIIKLLKNNDEITIKIEETEMKELLHLILTNPIIINKKFKKFISFFDSKNIVNFDI
jgi:hypothetical protein